MLLRLLRAQNWAKNFLVFVPPLCAHRFDDFSAWASATAAFAIFSMAASGQYVLNDVLDAEHDRAHPLKSMRPVASGEIGVTQAVVVAAGLIIGSLAASWMMGPGFLALVVLYHLLAAAYSWGLNHVAPLDLLLLVTLYLLRIFGGGTATGVAVSGWLIAALLFPLFSLATVKRYSQLRALESGLGPRTRLRGYTAEDTDVLLAAGVSSAAISALVLALYVNGDEAALYYSNPERLWLLCPLPLCALGRMWLQARRGELHEDPLAYMTTDTFSYVVLGSALAVGWAAL